MRRAISYVVLVSFHEKVCKNELLGWAFYIGLIKTPCFKTNKFVLILIPRISVAYGIKNSGVPKIWLMGLVDLETDIQVGLVVWNIWG